MEEKDIEKMTLDEKVEDFYKYFQNKKEYNLQIERALVVGLYKDAYYSRNKGQKELKEFDKLYEIIKYHNAVLTRSEDNFTVMKAYMFSNEYLDKLFESKEINVNGKKVFLVGTGLCQVYNTLLKGAKEITIGDANMFLEPSAELKTALICSMNRKDFLDYYNYNFPEHFFENHNVYAKASQYLNSNAKEFWDRIMLESDKEILELLFHRDCCYHGSKFYKEDDEYNKLQQLLKQRNFKIDYKIENFSDFPKTLKDKYDFMSFSNIKEYYGNENKFYDVLKVLYEKNLALNGVMQTNSHLYNGEEEKETKNLKQLLPGSKVFKIRNSGIICNLLYGGKLEAYDSVLVRKERENVSEKDMIK